MKYRKVYCKDCGKLLHKMAYYNKTKRCPSCAIKKRFKNPKEIKKISKSQKKRFKDPKKRKQHSIDIKKGMKEPEIRKKMNLSHKGKRNINYGKKRSLKTRKKISNSLKKLYKDPKKNPRYIDGRSLKKNYCKDCGKSISWQNKNKRCRKCACIYFGKQHRKKNNTCWQGGKSFEPYDTKFDNIYKESIRKRDNYTCQLCGMKQKKHLKLWKQKLHVHHIDYNKMNTQPKNNNSLCILCNGKVNKNREEWTKYFQKLMKRKYNYKYDKS